MQNLTNCLEGTVVLLHLKSREGGVWLCREHTHTHNSCNPASWQGISIHCKSGSDFQQDLWVTQAEKGGKNDAFCKYGHKFDLLEIRRTRGDHWVCKISSSSTNILHRNTSKRYTRVWGFKMKRAIGEKSFNLSPTRRFLSRKSHYSKASRFKKKKDNYDMESQ